MSPTRWQDIRVSEAMTTTIGRTKHSINTQWVRVGNSPGGAGEKRRLTWKETKTDATCLYIVYYTNCYFQYVEWQFWNPDINLYKRYIIYRISFNIPNLGCHPTICQRCSIPQCIQELPKISCLLKIPSYPNIRQLVTARASDSSHAWPYCAL